MEVHKLGKKSHIHGVFEPPQQSQLKSEQDRPTKAAEQDKPNNSNRLQDTSFNELGFEDQLEPLVTAKWSYRQTNTVKKLIRNAHFSAPFATAEEVSYYEDRKLDKAQMLCFSIRKFVEEEN